jgi:hypothetical protein
MHSKFNRYFFRWWLSVRSDKELVRVVLIVRVGEEHWGINVLLEALGALLKFLQSGSEL